MFEDKGFGITTRGIPFLRRDGRLRFALAKPLRVRIMEWATTVLWLCVAGITIGMVL
ncbi:MAG TPA: hypothetical protein VFC18_19675 [Burkholderiales bacterium]|nr:hypothetical protein [Burkholderiales bacterium]